MDHTLLVLMCLWCLVGVFGDEVKSVSVTEGHSVTLHTDLIDIQTHDKLEWRFKDFLIARIKRSVNINPTYDETEIFRDRLKMSNQTGDLTITNIRTEHAGSYTLEIITGDEQSIKSFNITVSVAYVVDAGKVKSVSVMERHSVTLHTDLSHIQTHDRIEWRFKNIRISRIKRSVNINPLYYNDKTEIFRDKLKMNNQTGDLIITHITSQHSGLYQLEIIAGDKRTIKSFNITVTATSTVSISESTQTPMSTESSSVSAEDPSQAGKTLIYCCVAVGCVMNVAALLVFCICGKHSNTQRQDQTNDDEFTYTNITFYQENTQPKESMDCLDRQAESEMTEVVYTCYNIGKDRSRLLSDQ